MRNFCPYKCLSIAGFDGSGGAGIQADIKTFSALGCYAMTVLTALPVQNTMGVRRCYDISISCIEEQLQAIFDDMVPDAIKIGMLFSVPIIETVATCLRQNAPHIPIVLDPVMVAKSGDLLLQIDAIDALSTLIMPQATLITPNLPEAATLLGQKSCELSQTVAQKLLKFGSDAVLLKGGHATGARCDDLLLDQHGNQHGFSSPRVVSQNTHGTGCTLSAAIASFLAQKYPLPMACKRAKQYVFEALCAAKDQRMGKGQGPVHHFYRWWTHAKSV